MWKREEAQERNESRDARPPHAETRLAGAGASATSKRGEQATIGPSITIRGDVTGNEDLLIQGRVEGSVQLDQHAVTVGEQGEVAANISARSVTVEGTVEGNLRAHEQIVLRSTARVMGDVIAPRVVLEDGPYFRGGVDMGEPSGRGAGAEQGRRQNAAPARAGEATAAPADAAAPPQIALDA